MCYDVYYVVIYVNSVMVQLYIFMHGLYAVRTAYSLHKQGMVINKWYQGFFFVWRGSAWRLGILQIQ
jgi:hypothetical protein